MTQRGMICSYPLNLVDSIHARRLTLLNTEMFMAFVSNNGDPFLSPLKVILGDEKQVVEMHEMGEVVRSRSLSLKAD